MPAQNVTVDAKFEKVYKHYTSPSKNITAVSLYYSKTEAADAGSKTYEQLIKDGVKTHTETSGNGNKDGILFAEDVLIADGLKTGGGQVTANADNVAITVLKVDASEIESIENKRLEITFHSQCQASGKSSQVHISKIPDVADLDAATFDSIIPATSGDVTQHEIQAVDTNGADLVYDATEDLTSDEDHIVYYMIHTKDAREQRITNLDLRQTPVYSLTSEIDPAEAGTTSVTFSIGDGGAEVTKAAQSEEIYVNINVDPSYILDKVEYTPSGEESATTITEDSGKYHFTMPDKSVAVKVTVHKNENQPANVTLKYKAGGEDVGSETIENKHVNDILTVEDLAIYKENYIKQEGGKYKVYTYSAGLEEQKEINDTNYEIPVTVTLKGEYDYYADYDRAAEQTTTLYTYDDAPFGFATTSTDIGWQLTDIGNRKKAGILINGKKAVRTNTLTLSSDGIGAESTVKFEAYIKATAPGNVGGNISLQSTDGTNLFEIGIAGGSGSDTPTLTTTIGTNEAESTTLSKSDMTNSSDKIPDRTNRGTTPWIKVEATINFTTNQLTLELKNADSSNASLAKYENKEIPTGKNVGKFNIAMGGDAAGFAFDEIAVSTVA